jgi:hypothetical protein
MSQKILQWLTEHAPAHNLEHGGLLALRWRAPRNLEPFVSGMTRAVFSDPERFLLRVVGRTRRQTPRASLA